MLAAQVLEDTSVDLHQVMHTAATIILMLVMVQHYEHLRYGGGANRLRDETGMPPAVILLAVDMKVHR